MCQLELTHDPLEVARQPLAPTPNGQRNSRDTILNSQQRLSPLESASNTENMNVGTLHGPLAEEFRAAYGQENKYGVPRIQKVK